MEFNELLAIDIGAGTQDILIYDKDKYIENCVKMILPSYCSIISARVKKATEEGKNIFLHGGIMGGHPMSSSVKKHIKTGYKVYSTETAAKTFRDNLEEIKRWGIEIVPSNPGDSIDLELTDINLDFLAVSLSHYGIKLPSLVAIAVQDHGECIDGSNRKFRFSHWKKFLDKGGNLRELICREPPPYFTRMISIKNSLKCETLFMDTGPAGIIGAFCDKKVEDYKKKGLVIVNIGNQHVICSSVKDDRILAILEHHSREMNEENIIDVIKRFKERNITDDEVFSGRGHGVYFSEDLTEDTSSWPVVITGPKRQLACRGDYYFAVPNGDMMLTGCFGLLEGARNLV
jgi:uncharacterized protein (DUF1786 family)